MKKATLTFMGKFLWLLVNYQLSPTNFYNEFTWDRAVMVVTLVAALEIQLARIILAAVKEREFKTSFHVLS